MQHTRPVPPFYRHLWIDRYGRFASQYFIRGPTHCKRTTLPTITDRSMLGDRDSELGLVIKDTARVESRMDGKEVSVGRFVRDLRIRLWQVCLREDHDGNSRGSMCRRRATRA